MDEDDEDEDSSSDEDEMEDIDVVWFRTADGTWIRHWRETAPQQWKPTSENLPPEGLTRTAASIQAIWRGHTVRTDMSAAGALLALATSVYAK